MNKQERAIDKIAKKFNILSELNGYSQNFNWLGLKIVKLPTDLHIFQEIIHKTKPNIIIETGIAHGGSLLFYASMLMINKIRGRVIGIDIDLRKKNKKKIKKNYLFNKYISIIDGDSTDAEVVKKIKKISKNKKTMVILDSNHTEEHVKKELEIYSKIVTRGNYLIVQDTGISHMPEQMNKNRAWNKKNNPHTAVRKFLKSNSQFINDINIYKKIYFSCSPDGFLKKK
jgi:cephalosporin hydroxylase